MKTLCEKLKLNEKQMKVRKQIESKVIFITATGSNTIMIIFNIMDSSLLFL